MTISEDGSTSPPNPAGQDGPALGFRRQGDLDSVKQTIERLLAYSISNPALSVSVVERMTDWIRSLRTAPA